MIFKYFFTCPSRSRFHTIVDCHAITSYHIILKNQTYSLTSDAFSVSKFMHKICVWSPHPSDTLFSFFYWVLFCFFFFFVPVFISCSFDLVCFFAVIGNWEAFTYFQISLKTPTMRLTKGHHGKLNRQNRNEMGEDRERKLIANHQQFNKWINQIIGFLTSRFFSHLFLFRVLLFCFVFSSSWQLRSV